MTSALFVSHVYYIDKDIKSIGARRSKPWALHSNVQVATITDLANLATCMVTTTGEVEALRAFPLQ
jgi:hypothetical protein